MKKKMKTNCYKYSAQQISQFAIWLSFINKHIFVHLKLEIALVIPALNAREIDTNISTAHVLI